MFSSSLGKYAIGALAGVCGMTFFTSKFAQRGYKYVVAGAMIAKDRVMADTEKVQAAAGNIKADAKEMTEKYYAMLDREYEEANTTEA